METSADITDISFADFETKTTEENECYEEDWRHLKLQKAENIFASDQTPTPTRLIKNCDEVGLFEDLNPFDLGFQRATEQNVSGTESRTEPVANDGDSLHTPQVYAVDPPPVAVEAAAVNDAPNESSALDVEQLLATTSVAAPIPLEGPPPLQLIQPQVITWVLPPQSLGITTEVSKVRKSSASASTNTIPAQTVRPYILPKPSSAPVAHKLPLPPLIAPNPPPPEPSSASLTPTSQLPIKERLKAIIHSNNNKRTFVPPPKTVKTKPHRDEDCMERRRAAATRYRNKMRNEHKELRLQNAQLQQENQELRDKIARLERELQQQDKNNNLSVPSNPIQIPGSAIHLVFNVPKMIVPTSTGLRRRPIQQPVAIDPQYEQEYAFLAQMMEQHARRRLQQQFDQQLHEINMKMDRQRQLLERERYRQRQQELQVEREAEEDEYGNNLENQQYDQYDNVEAEGYYGSPMDGMPAQAPMPPMPPMPPMQSIYLPTTHSERLDDNIRRNKAQKERIPFAVGPNDARFFDNPNDPSGELDSRALDDYEEYAPLEPTVASATPRSKVASPVSAPVPVEPPKLLDASNANFHRINPQTAAAAAVAGASASNSHEINALIDKLQKQSKSSHHPQLTLANGVAGGEAAEQIVLRQHLGMNSEMGVYIVALIAGVSAAVTVGLLALGVTWFHNRSKAAADVDYPAYGVTGPNKDVSPSGDRKLAQSAQMYHYQHQKQQIIAMENCQATDGSCGLSDVESDDDNEEGDYTVYECPGLAPTGEMEVKNPLFLDETPATPANNLATNSSSNGPSNGTSGTNNNITQATPQQPATVKKGSIKPNMNLLNAAASAVAKEEQKKRKSKK